MFLSRIVWTVTSSYIALFCHDRVKCTVLMRHRRAKNATKINETRETNESRLRNHIVYTII